MISTDVNILVIGDPHFKVSGVPEHNKMCESVIKNIKDRNIDLIVILGDILDRHETIHISPLTRSINFLGELIKIAPVFNLIGNHDLKNNKQFLSDEHPFSSFNLLDNLHKENINNITNLISEFVNPDLMTKIMDNIETIVNSKKITIVDKVIMTTIKNQNFIFVPYVPSGKFQEALNTLNHTMDNITCIFAHQEFKGAQMGSITSTDGDMWSVNNPYIISGHIHNRQHLQENILYVGTPIQHSFGDNPNKTISYFSFKSPSIRTEERINLGLPRKHTAKISCEEVNKYIPPVNSIVRITITGNYTSLKTIMNHPNVIKWEKLGHKVTTKEIPIVDDKNIHISKEDNIINKAPPKFSTALQMSISKNIQLQQLYCNIFGSKNIESDNQTKKILKLKIIT